MNEAYVRILLTRGVGETSYDPAATPTPSLVIIVKPIENPPARVDREGIKISMVSILRNHPQSVNPIIKSNNLLNNALAMQEALRKGGEEALLCNYRGELAECAQSNFFIVRERGGADPAQRGRVARGNYARVPLRRGRGSRYRDAGVRRCSRRISKRPTKCSSRAPRAS